MNWITEQLGIGPSTQQKLLITGIVVILLLVARWMVLRSIHTRFDEADVGYRARKVVTYVATFVGMLALAWIWIDAFSNLSTFLGLLSAGVAIALSDVLKNMVGWGYIMSRRPFRVGDRVEVAGTKGDVVDVRLFRFSLMEVGNWVDAEQSTGRLVHVPNGTLFTDQVANYTEGFEYIWHELPVLVTFESDWRRAEAIILGALKAHAPDLERGAATRIRQTARTYHIKIGAPTPIVYLTVKDSGVQLTARFLVGARERRGVEQAVWRAVLDGFAAEPAVELAYPTTRTYFHGPVALSGPPVAAEARFAE